MARKQLVAEAPVDNSDSIVQQAQEYIKYKEEESGLKKILSGLNTSLKQHFESHKGIDAIKCGKKSVVYSVTEQTSFNEDLLISYFEKHPLEGVVKTKQYIDFDVLESAIYNGKLTDEQVKELNTFKIVKKIPKLNIRAVKRGDDE